MFPFLSGRQLTGDSFRSFRHCAFRSSARCALCAPAHTSGVPAQIGKICNYLKNGGHPEAIRLMKIICVPEGEPEGEPSPQESPSPNLSPDAVARLALAAAAAAAAGIVATGTGGALGGLKPAVSRLVSRIHLANMVRANVHKAGGLIKRASSFRTFQNAARGSRGVYALRFARIGPLAVLALVADVVLSSALSAGAQAANRRKKCAPTQYGLNRCSGGDALTPEEYAKHWESSDHWGDSGLNWGEITRGVDLIDQVGSFDAASIAKELGADLQEVADTITQAASVGVSTDLEAAAQGLGYGSFADAVAAYNEKYGTNYTVESAKEALGQ